VHNACLRKTLEVPRTRDAQSVESDCFEISMLFTLNWLALGCWISMFQNFRFPGDSPLLEAVERSAVHARTFADVGDGLLALLPLNLL
jgi:hypothetical protein